MSAPAREPVSVSYGSLSFRFDSASGLRDALLGSFTEADYLGGPLVRVGRDDADPAWLWVGRLARLRSDWREAAGVALQHATSEGGELAQRALCDLLANDHGSIVLREWTHPLAARYPDALSTRANTGWGGGGPEARLEDVVAEQARYWQQVSSPARQVILDDRGTKASLAELPDASALEPLLLDTAAKGRYVTTGWGDGPWGWLMDEVVLRPWLPDALPPAVERVSGQTAAAAHAALDWLSDGWDLWRFEAMLERWRQSPPPWWSVKSKTKPPKWKRPIRPAAWFGLDTLGEVALRLGTLARGQAASAPLVDLDRLA